jgi:alkane 1-monooxygenase
MAVAYLLAYFIPLLYAAALGAGGYWLWLPAVFVFFIHPVLDAVAGRYPGLKPTPASAIVADSILWTYPFVQAALLFFTLQEIRAMAPQAVNAYEFWAMAVSFGLFAGAIGITAAHELVHRTERWQRGLGVFLLVMVNYAHFRIEHVFGHHKWVSTPLDPASAKKDESLFAFWPRTLWGSYRNAWKIEQKRNKPFHQNRMVHYAGVRAVMVLAIYFYAGVPGLVFFAVESLIAILLLETINYIEHYGLRRKETAPGRFEAVEAWHSWNTPSRMTNWFLFNLGLHSHHHESPLVHYQKLNNPPEAVNLPGGYSSMLILALFPPLWFRVMNPRVP